MHRFWNSYVYNVLGSCAVLCLEAKGFNVSVDNYFVKEVSQMYGQTLLCVIQTHKFAMHKQLCAANLQSENTYLVNIKKQTW